MKKMIIAGFMLVATVPAVAGSVEEMAVTATAANVLCSAYFSVPKNSIAYLIQIAARENGGSFNDERALVNARASQFVLAFNNNGRAYFNRQPYCALIHQELAPITLP